MTSSNSNTEECAETKLDLNKKLFNVVENSFAKLDLSFMDIFVSEIDESEVLSILSGSLNAKEVWRFSFASFFDGLVVIPVHSTADTRNGAIDDILAYFNDAVGDRCMLNGVDAKSASDVEFREEISKHSGQIVSESIKALRSMIYQINNEYQAEKSLMHYATIVAGSVLISGAKRGAELGEVSGCGVKLLLANVGIGNN